MPYVCVENNNIVSILGYEPTVPNTVSVTEITDQDLTGIEAKTHYFDVANLTVKSYSQAHLDTEAAKETQRITNAEKRKFLADSDWKVMRHLREKALGQATSLTDQQYLDLEQARATAAAAIVEIQ
jgi:hypothetical protein